MAKVSKGIVGFAKSRIDGSNVVVIAIAQSSNTKTGNMVQTYILNADVDPITANRTGADYGICGDCPHRGIADPSKESGLANGRSCYVNLGQGVMQVYKAFKAGKYAQLTADQLQTMGADRMVRLGTYGDPAAIDTAMFNPLLSKAIGSTGYTHQSGILDTDKRLMVSADNMQDAANAHAKGRRTFRVIPVAVWQDKTKGALLSNEILCPASVEAGAKVQCDKCGLCDGTKQAKSVAIVAHGAGKKNAK